MKKKLLALTAAAMLLTGCGDDISSQETAETSSVSQAKAGASSSSEAPSAEESSGESDGKDSGGYEYTDTVADPFALENYKPGEDEWVQDYDTFKSCEDIPKSVWGAYYESKFGADKSRLIPKCPDGVSDLGGAANMTNINCGMAMGDINDPDNCKTFTVIISLDNKFDSIQSLYDNASAESTDITRDSIYISDNMVIEHFTESIYFEYTVDILTPDGFRAAVSSISKQTTLDELISFAQSLTF